MHDELYWHVWPMNSYLPSLFAILCGSCLTDPFQHDYVNTRFINTQCQPLSKIDVILDEQWK